MKDGSRSTANAVQTEFANRSLALQLKVEVLSEREKVLLKNQVRVKKLNASEPLDDMSKQLLVNKNKQLDCCL
jgi:hypothetical protein